MEKINIAFHTRGGIGDSQRMAIKRLEAMEMVNLTVILERQSGRKADTIFAEVVRLWKRFGAYSIIFVARRLWIQFQATGDDDLESSSIDSNIITVDNIHSRESLQQLKDLDPDLGIVYGHRILKTSVFNVPELDTVGIHWGTVPDYRGKRCVFWEMYYDEKSTAVTFQVVEEGIDTGQIIKQIPVEIEPTDTLSAVKSRMSKTTAEELPKIVNEYIENGKNIKTTKQPSGGELYTDPKLRHIVVFQIRRSLRRLLK